MVGVTSKLRPAAPYGHVCWAYDDRATFASRALTFLLEGLSAGQRVWYVATDEADDVAAWLREHDPFADALRRGAAAVVPLGAAYADGGTVDPDSQVAAYAAATEAALTAGHTGFRVVADATPLVRTPAQLDAFTRYEHRIDRYMRVHPMSALCAYDRRTLGDRTVGELACMHPETNADEVLFRLHACLPDDGAAALGGELDPSNHELFRVALERADPRPVDGEVVVDATDLRFIDHRSLIHLQEYAQRRDLNAVLHTPLTATGRLVELLDLSRVRVAAAR